MDTVRQMLAEDPARACETRAGRFPESMAKDREVALLLSRTRKTTLAADRLEMEQLDQKERTLRARVKQLEAKRARLQAEANGLLGQLR